MRIMDASERTVFGATNHGGTAPSDLSETIR